MALPVSVRVECHQLARLVQKAFRPERFSVGVVVLVLVYTPASKSQEFGLLRLSMPHHRFGNIIDPVYK